MEIAGASQIIAQLELLPVLGALWQWPQCFRAGGRRVLIFIDNDAARFSLIKGYSPARASRPIISATWREIARTQASPWFERVPSKGNPADGPSRLRFKELDRLEVGVRQVDMVASEQRLLEIFNGGR